MKIGIIFAMEEEINETLKYSDVINEYKSLIVKDKIKILEKDFSDAFNAGDLSKAEQIKSDMNYYNDIISFLSHSEDE